MTKNNELAYNEKQATSIGYMYLPSSTNVRCDDDNGTIVSFVVVALEVA